ncbi:MAG: hypothetical protein AAFY71_18570 [Bacteroidota bacterium]
MNQSFTQKVKQFSRLEEILFQKGYKKKVIAMELGLYPSAYSTLSNIVFPKIKSLKKNGVTPEKAIEGIFQQVNNISEKRVRREIGGYILKLEKLVQEVESDQHPSPHHYLDELCDNSPTHIMKQLEGIYECFYISTFGYKVKREPFLIQKEENKTGLSVQKGNAKGTSILKGFAYITNPNIFTIQLLEEGQLNKDHFMGHFLLPPTYEGNLNLIKGMVTSVSNAHFPISRKVLLKKVHETPSPKLFNEMETFFYEGDEQNEACHSILTFLRNSHSLMEYFPIPRPSYGEKDLEIELEIQRLIE